MDELEKFKAVNSCETIEALKNCILLIADIDGMIQGRTRQFNAEKMASYVEHVTHGDLPANVLTREFGIRQQALYLKHYNGKF